MPGPPPKTDAVRRNKKLPGVTLPASGPDGPAPVWPAGFDPTWSQQKVWDELWTLPQAHAWATLKAHRSVARYCELFAPDFVEDEGKTTRSDNASELRQMEDRLGLHPLAMRRLEWTISEDELAARRAERDSTARRPSKARATVKAVDLS